MLRYAAPQNLSTSGNSAVAAAAILNLDITDSHHGKASKFGNKTVRLTLPDGLINPATGNPYAPGETFAFF